MNCSQSTNWHVHETTCPRIGMSAKTPVTESHYVPHTRGTVRVGVRFIVKESWQRKWNHGFSGYYTRMLIPTVGDKLFFPSSRDIGISCCRMLLHDTMLMEDSFRTGTSDSPLCECGVECESVEHFLLCCPIHETARREMITDINVRW